MPSLGSRWRRTRCFGGRLRRGLPSPALTRMRRSVVLPMSMPSRSFSNSLGCEWLVPAYLVRAKCITSTPTASRVQGRWQSGPCGRRIADIWRLNPAKLALAVTPEQGGLRTGCWSAPVRSVWMTRPCCVVSQTRVCDTGPQFTPFSLLRCGSQRHSAIRTSWRESVARVLRLRPHQPPQSHRAVRQRRGNPTSAVAGCGRGALSHLSGCRDLRDQQPAGLALSGPRLAQGDTLVVVSIDRIGRRWLDTMGSIHDLQRRGVRIRGLADNEQSWAHYLDDDPDSPESFLGYTLAGFAAVPRRVWRRRRLTARNWEFVAGCPRSRRPRSSRW